MLRDWKGKGNNVFESLTDWVVDISKSGKKVISVEESVDKRSRVLEEGEKEFERRKSEVVKVENLRPLLKDFTKDVELREEKLDEQMKVVTKHIEDLEAAQNEVHRMKLLQREKLTEIEGKEREIDLIHVSLDKRRREVEQREKECKSDQNKAEGLKHQLREEAKAIEEKSKEVHVERLSLENRLREVEQREKECRLEQNKAHGLKHLLCKKEKVIEEKERSCVCCRTRLI